MDFMFRRLKVYLRAIRLAEQLDADCKLVRAKGNYPMTDQMRRAAMSIPINIAEGNARSTSADKRRFFIIARGSCFELTSLLELAEKLEYLSQNRRRQHESEMKIIGKMLTALSTSV